MIKPLRFFRAQGADHVAVVSVEPATEPGRFFVRLARGQGGTAYGPYHEVELAARVAEVVAALQAEGFFAGGLGEALAGLAHEDSRARARAAARLGRRGGAEAIAPLLGALEAAVDDRCTIIDALGAAGAAALGAGTLSPALRAQLVAALRAEAARKLLSRRRSAVEALRRLGDEEGLAQAAARARERLAEPLLAALDALAAGAGDEAALQQALLALPEGKRGLAVDTLYELAVPAADRAVRAAIAATPLARPGFWRYAKSVFKRAALRGDWTTFGFVAHRVEAEGRTSTGTRAEVKSGYDGVKRETPIFRRKTQQYLRRAAWRALRQLAAARPQAYAEAAAAAIVPYGPEDRALPHKRYGALAGCYVLHRVLWSAGGRHVCDPRSLRFRLRDGAPLAAPAGQREEPFAALWDAQPRAYLRLLAEARLPEAQAFAAEAVRRRHPQLLQQASGPALAAMLEAPYAPTVELALAELGRRFDPQAPDWGLLERLLASESDSVREQGQRLVELCAPAWTRSAARSVALLRAPHPATRERVADLLVAAGPQLAAAEREALAAQILATLREGEPEAGAHAALARVARDALAAELNARCDVDALVALIDGGSDAAKGLAGALLGRRPEALAALGMERVIALAEHGIAAVRGAAHALLAGAVEQLRADPGLLFVLVESEWVDTRQLAFTMLREQLDPAALGLDGLVGLCDSTRLDVQQFGEQLVRQRFATLEPHELIYRLAEHPHPNMRRFALDLIVEHLKDGFIPLAKVEVLLRAVLLDVWPSRRQKNRVIDFLGQRGLRDERQAQVAANILAEVAASKTAADFARALAALTQLKLAFPEIDAPLALAAPPLAGGAA